MDLKEHARAELGAGQYARQLDHGALDDIGGAALDRGVDGGALGEAAVGGMIGVPESVTSLAFTWKLVAGSVLAFLVAITGNGQKTARMTEAREQPAGT